jgi:hypothetical protein
VDGLIEAVNLFDERDKTQIQVDWYGRKEVASGNAKVYHEAIKKLKDIN